MKIMLQRPTFEILACSFLLLIPPVMSFFHGIAYLQSGFFTRLVIASVCVFAAIVVARDAVRRASWVAGLLSLLLLLHAANLFSPGIRPDASIGLAAPGSVLTQYFLYDAAPAIRRISEPSLWVLFAGIGLFGTFRKTATILQISLLSFVVMLGVEGWIRLRSESLPPEHFFVWVLLHYAVLALSLLLLVSGCLQARIEKTDRRELRVPWGLVVAVLCMCLFGAYATTKKSDRSIVAGAHYYSWFPENWRAGHAGRVAAEPYVPALGEYLSDGAGTFAQHLAWAEEGKLDLFVFDWWPNRLSVRRRLGQFLEGPLAEGGALQFAIQYETLDLKTSERRPRKDEDPNVLRMTAERASRLEQHWLHIAKTFANHPSYFRINGRPVLFVYASRHVVGDVATAFRYAREEVRKKTGVDFYLVGDEVYFNVLTLSKNNEVILLPEGEPDWKRLGAFDAITCYNPYDSHRKEHAGHAGQEVFLSDVQALYERYRKIASLMGLRFVPGIVPGYDDTGVRPDENHFVIPRRMQDSQESFFSRSLREWVNVRRDELFVVTSWNEWNEGTQIEPAKSLESPVQKVDCQSLEEDSTYGCRYLSELKQFLSKSP